MININKLENNIALQENRQIILTPARAMTVLKTGDRG
jgi:hypothetical protein